MILMGEGRAGKTSLWKALVDRKFNERESTTHGINAEQVTTRYVNGWHALRKDEAAGEFEKGLACFAMMMAESAGSQCDQSLQMPCNSCLTRPLCQQELHDSICLLLCLTSLK